MNEEKLASQTAEFLHMVGLLVRRVRAAASGSDLSPSQLSAMATLDKQGPATTSDLARNESMKPQSMGAIIASLEEMGLVERLPHATDGRQVNIQLTSKGFHLRKTARDAKLAWLTDAISKLDERDQQTLFDAGKIMNRLVHK